MEHIKQRSLVEGLENQAYTVVNTEGWTLPLQDHPSVVEHPEIFEVVDTDIPEWYQLLNYISEIN
jgi:hypothetical protein